MPLFVLFLLTAGCGEKNQEIGASRNHLFDARKAIRDGDTAKAIASLNASIESQPNVWAYFELAVQHLKAGDEQAALANCEKVLELKPEMADALWFKGELQKPEPRRFIGRFKNPPSSRK